MCAAVKPADATEFRFRYSEESQTELLYTLSRERLPRGARPVVVSPISPPPPPPEVKEDVAPEANETESAAPFEMITECTQT